MQAQSSQPDEGKALGVLEGEASAVGGNGELQCLPACVCVWLHAQQHSLLPHAHVASRHFALVQWGSRSGAYGCRLLWQQHVSEGQP